MNSLYNIFKNEKQRNPDMTIFYRDNKSQKLCYKNDEGILEINFKYNTDKKCEFENLYFTPANEKHGSKIADLEVYGNGTVYSAFTKAAYKLPDRFKLLFDEWRFDRKIIKVDEKSSYTYSKTPKKFSQANRHRDVRKESYER